ncbi:MAG: primosomal protein N' [Phycisphaeraceae bacterium]|nr:primosomal protein N' [Phycisphaeraceae bacterium]
MESDLFHPETPTPAMTRFARVVVERGIDRAGDSADAGLTYGAPDDVHPGQRVVVPLGRGDKLAAGIVVAIGGAELLAGLSASRVKPIARVTPVTLTPLIVKLASWMSDYYVAPLGMVFGTMLPAAVKKQTGTKTRVYVDRAPVAIDTPLPKRLARAWEQVQALPAEAFPTTPRALAMMLDGVTESAVKKLIENGHLLATSKQEVQESRDWLMDCANAQNASSTGSAQAAGPLALTEHQTAALDRVAGTLGTFAVHCLHGVTGSGKTEVYLRAIEAMLARDNPHNPHNPAHTSTAIMLVPEIALTPQTASRFTARFGDRVAVLHSGLTASQRHGQWLACAQGSDSGGGRVRIVVGARSAIFAPLRNVGLIVVDEEHDSSYKQDQLPRYHGRDVAIKRAQLEGCPVILGSATPSLETWANTKQAPPSANAPAGTLPSASKYILSSLPARVGQARLPPVQIVDLADERRLRALVQPEGWRDRHLHLIGPTLEDAIGQTLTGKGQVLLLLNRRGYANYICCTDPKCGWVMQCEHCDVTTVYHIDRRLKAGGFVRCHHCLAELTLPASCPECKKTINTFGLGTQRVEAELERKFGPSHALAMGTTLLRLDGDSMQTARDYFTALSRFASGQARVLLGTQMIAKGLDYPGVRLVGVISADTSLSFPDFRAAERTFQLVAQVAGRAGRGKDPGRVIVQTANPQEPAIVLAARHDYVRFADFELAQRTESGLPPIKRMARVVCRDVVLAKAQNAAAEIAGLLREFEADLGLRVVGPMPCAIARIGDHHRIEVQVTANSRTAIQRAFASLREQGLLVSDAHTAVDVDPIALL